MRKSIASVRLEKDELFGYPAFSGTVSCESGVLWISWKGSPDVVLAAGRSHAVSGARGFLVQALRGPAAARVEPEGEAAAQRLPAISSRPIRG